MMGYLLRGAGITLRLGAKQLGTDHADKDDYDEDGEADRRGQDNEGGAEQFLKYLAAEELELDGVLRHAVRRVGYMATTAIVQRALTLLLNSEDYCSSSAFNLIWQRS